MSRQPQGGAAILAPFVAAADQGLGQGVEVHRDELGAAEFRVNPAGLGYFGDEAVNALDIVGRDARQLRAQIVVLYLLERFHGGTERGERVLDFMRHIGGEAFHRVDPAAQGNAHVGQGAGEQADLVPAFRQARHFDRTVAAQAHADRCADQGAQRLHDGPRQEQRQLDRNEQGHAQHDGQGSTRIADGLSQVAGVAGHQQQFARCADRRGRIDHRRIVARGPGQDSAFAGAGRFGQFGPGGNLVHAGFAIGIGGGRIQDQSHRIVDQPSAPFVPTLARRIDQREARFAEGKAVQHKLAALVIDAQPQVLALADLHEQASALCRASDGETRSGDFRFGAGQLEALLEQLLAIGIEIEQAARHQAQGDDVHCQDAHGQAGAALPAGAGACFSHR